MKLNVIALGLILIPLAPSVRSQDPVMPVVAGRQEASSGVRKYNQALADALLMQLKADSLARIARDKRIYARETPEEALRTGLVREAVQYENEAKRIQAEADRLFDRAREIRSAMETADVSSDSLLRLAKTINDIRVYEYRIEPTGSSETVTPSVPTGPSEIAAASEPTGPYETAAPSEPKGPSEIAAPSESSGTGMAEGQAVAFNILKSSPYGEKNPFPLLTQVEEGLVYRIQLGAFSSPAAFDAFGGIVPVYVETFIGSNLYKYYAGGFQTLMSVTVALDRIRGSGFTDAFIVAFFEGRQISTDEARKIEYAEFEL